MLVLLLAALAFADDTPPVDVPADAATADAAPPADAPPVPAPDVTPATSADLATEAWRRIDRGDYEGARLLGQEIVGRTDEEYAEGVAILGVSWELDGDPGRAIEAYREALDKAPDPKFADDMRFRIAEATGTNGDVDDARKQVRALEKSHDWDATDELKIRLVEDIWLLQGGHPRKGLRRLSKDLSGLPADELAFYQAKSRAAIARAYVDRSASLSLDVGEKKQVKRLNERAQLLEAADAQVVAAIDLKEPEWGLEGMLVLGNGYEDVADDMLAAPPPAYLDADQRKLYTDLVQQRAAVVYGKASRYYRAGLDTAERLDWKSKRIDELKAADDAVRAKIEALPIPGATPAPPEDGQQAE